MKARSSIAWSHESVLKFCRGKDPIAKITEIIRDFVLKAIDEGLSGPPFDPFFLAKILKIDLVPAEIAEDARILRQENGKYKIEFNPNRPKSRIRFSIAHEIVHSFFEDCGEECRYRGKEDTLKESSWQLEMLCNIGAAEILMPIGSFPELKDEQIKISKINKLRKDFDVSIESVLLRFAKLTEAECLIFSASRKSNGSYTIDYSAPSKNWKRDLYRGYLLPEDSIVKTCTAIGYTAEHNEAWGAHHEKLHIECIGLPPYPGHLLPRVAGFVTPELLNKSSQSYLTFVKGDVLDAIISGNVVIPHIINDKARSWWKKGFAGQLLKKWPILHEDFHSWITEDPLNLKLGHSKVCQVKPEIFVNSMVAQRGYGYSNTSRVNYEALEKCFQQLCLFCKEKRATVHMPRIGTGEAGGSWEIISELLEETICKNKIPVTVYCL